MKISRLTLLRQERGMTVADLAEQLELDPSSIYRWERGEGFPRDPLVKEKLGEIFELPWNEILEIKEVDF